jgi:glycyl-tRNA synthetase beta subunit
MEYIDLIEAEEFAKLFFTEEEIIIILTESPEDYRTAIRKGRLISDATIRKKVVSQAGEGIAEAQKLVEKWKMEIAIREAI